MDKKDERLMKFRNLTDFEKNLYLKREIKTLKEKLKLSEIEKGKLISEYEEKLYKAGTLTKKSDYLRIIKDLENKVRKLKRENGDLFERIVKQQKDE